MAASLNDTILEGAIFGALMDWRMFEGRAREEVNGGVDRRESKLATALRTRLRTKLLRRAEVVRS